MYIWVGINVEEQLKEIKDKSVVNKILLAVEIVFYLYLFLKMSLNLCYGTETEFQINRDYHNYKAICYLLGIIIIATRAHIWHWICNKWLYSRLYFLYEKDDV